MNILFMSIHMTRLQTKILVLQLEKDLYVHDSKSFLMPTKHYEVRREMTVGRAHARIAHISELRLCRTALSVSESISLLFTAYGITSRIRERMHSRPSRLRVRSVRLVRELARLRTSSSRVAPAFFAPTVNRAGPAYFAV